MKFRYYVTLIIGTLLLYITFCVTMVNLFSLTMFDTKWIDISFKCVLMVLVFYLARKAQIKLEKMAAEM